jgi:hypothetical protein
MSETQALSPRERAEAVVRERGYPPRAPRRRMAQIICDEAFEIDHRTLERWRVPTRRLNGKCHLETIDALERAFEQLDAAPIIMGGHRQSNNNHAE